MMALAIQTRLGPGLWSRTHPCESCCLVLMLVFITCSAQDLAFALLQEQPDLVTSLHDQSSGGGAYLAAAAAAGQWAAVHSALQHEHESRPDYPAPPVPGSALHAKLVAAAAGAVTQGQAAVAVSMLGMAGVYTAETGHTKHSTT